MDNELSHSNVMSHMLFHCNHFLLSYDLFYTLHFVSTSHELLHSRQRHTHLATTVLSVPHMQWGINIVTKGIIPRLRMQIFHFYQNYSVNTKTEGFGAVFYWTWNESNVNHSPRAMDLLLKKDRHLYSRSHCTFGGFSGSWLSLVCCSSSSVSSPFVRFGTPFRFHTVHDYDKLQRTKHMYFSWSR